MLGLLVPQPFHKILVVGPLYDRTEKLAIVEEMLPQYDWTIFNSGLCHPTNDLSQIKQRIDKMKELIATQKVIYLAGRTDYLLLASLTKEPSLEKWLQECRNLAIIEFPNRTVIITDGGLTSATRTRKDLLDNLENSFVSQIEQKPWHQNYSGNLGYVISNNPLTQLPPQFYKHSMQLGNLYSLETAVYAQEVDEIGLKKTISL